MKIKDLVTKEQYIQLKKEYKLIVKNKQITFFQFCTEKKQIKNTLVKIDFHNGDIMHFFTYLAQAIAK